MNDSLITVRDLNIHFPIKRGVLSKTVGYVYAVDGVSFNLARGETLGIVGESGCGKTTAGMAVTQLIPITSGTVTWKGRDMRELSRSGLRKLRREMQLIFQDPYSCLLYTSDAADDASSV